VIIGTWQTRADWEAWHADPKFRETRKQMEGLEVKPAEEWWHEVVTDLRAAAERLDRDPEAGAHLELLLREQRGVGDARHLAAVEAVDERRLAPDEGAVALHAARSIG